MIILPSGSVWFSTLIKGFNLNLKEWGFHAGYDIRIELIKPHSLEQIPTLIRIIMSI